MNGRFLVAFDTKNGSTAEVAEAIGSRLRERGCAAEVRPTREVRDVEDIGALVVGAPIYSGRWLSGAHRVLKRAAKLPSDRRPLIAVFALGPRINEGPENWVRPREQFERALMKDRSIAPITTALFGGADPPKKKPRRDVRDWEAIRAWADEVAGLLAGPS
jgi:menaquinone-dependent protoporphyrinogen oxidase